MAYIYEFWEDYISGMYTLQKQKNENILIDMSVQLLCDQVKFKKTIERLIIEWPICYAYNMSNKSINRKAWLGAAACMLNHNSVEYTTRLAWNRMSQYEQRLANNTAEKFIMFYDRENQKLHTKVGTERLF